MGSLIGTRNSTTKGSQFAAPPPIKHALLSGEPASESRTEVLRVAVCSAYHTWLEKFESLIGNAVIALEPRRGAQLRNRFTPSLG
jgi:hypothetical protein